MRIGLILSHKGTNYGMMLQAFATQAYFDKLGIDTEIITISENKTVGAKIKRLIRHCSPTALRASLRKRKRRKLVAGDAQLSAAHKKRMEAGKDFVTNYLHHIVLYKGLLGATKAAKERYSCVLIGSDQQWAPACLYSDLNTLMFVPEGVKKVSYATSMGVSRIPKYTHKRLKKFIARMDTISVREETGRNIIVSVTGRQDVRVVPDPTFLLNQDEWKQFIPDQVLEREPYIFCYFLGDSGLPMQKVNEYAERTGLKVIAVRNIESYSHEKIDYGNATVLNGPSVNEFVNYIRHAKLVCTDSFHGTVFSIINSVDFVTFYRTKNSDKNSRNSRIDDLLQKLKTSHRIYTGHCELEEIAQQSIDYDVVNRIVDSMRTVGKDYLQGVLQ